MKVSSPVVGKLLLKINFQQKATNKERSQLNKLEYTNSGML